MAIHGREDSDGVALTSVSTSSFASPNFTAMQTEKTLRLAPCGSSFFRSLEKGVAHSAITLGSRTLPTEKIFTSTFGNPCWARDAYIRAFRAPIAIILIAASASRLFS